VTERRRQNIRGTQSVRAGKNNQDTITNQGGDNVRGKILQEGEIPYMIEETREGGGETKKRGRRRKKEVTLVRAYFP